MSIIDHARYFTNLPRDYYLSTDRYNREIEAIYGHQWLYVAHSSQVREKGDYFACDLPGGESVIVVRGDEGRVNAFHNVCRHRGFSLCDLGTGNTKVFVCPYHRWSYDVNGRLRSAAPVANGQCFDYEDYGLKPVRMEIWRGFIFVNFSAEVPEPLGPRFDAVAPDMVRIEPERLKLAHHKVYSIESNWKFVLENYIECSHCKSVHSSTLCVPMDIDAIFAEVGEYIKPAEINPMFIPTKEGSKSLSLDGRLVSTKLLGEFGRGVAPPNAFGTGFMIMPAITGALFQSDYGVVHRVDPVSPTKTLLHNWWFVHEDAVEGVDYSLDNLLAVWDKTDLEDCKILERQQRGAQSRGFGPGPHDPNREGTMRAGLELYLGMMGEAAAPTS
jgi:phenylpropionate dioxygenase-like ring-hydroxylating dioxygenase large terminal subunit